MLQSVFHQIHYKTKDRHIDGLLIGAGNRTFSCRPCGGFGQLGSEATLWPHSLPRYSNPDFPFMKSKNDHPLDDRFSLVRETGLEPA